MCLLREKKFMLDFKYKTRKGGATCTIFVPYDCGNNCPFCINKLEYKNHKNFSVEKICESILVMHEITPYCDFVFTGGEPLANLHQLQKMIDTISPTHKIYINTSLPIPHHRNMDDLVEFTVRNKERITCMNVSRHLSGFVKETTDNIFSKMAVPVRINCVLYGTFTADDLINYVNRFSSYNVSIQFRKDYTITTPENLYDEQGDDILGTLLKTFCYVGMHGVRMRCGYQFMCDNMKAVYHKTLPYSTIKENGYHILYDIIIKQTGEIHSDWDGTPLDIEKYRNVEYEVYQ